MSTERPNLDKAVLNFVLPSNIDRNAISHFCVSTCALDQSEEPVLQRLPCEARGTVLPTGFEK